MTSGDTQTYKVKGHQVKMKFIVLAGATALSCLGLAALADQTPANDQPESQTDQSMAQRERDRAHSWEMQRLGELSRANQFIGTDVQDNQGNKIGYVKDLALDMPNGRIVEVILASGGTLGLDENFTAVPPECFAIDTKLNALHLNADKGILATAAPFDLADWNMATEHSHMREVYHHFGIDSYFATSRQVPASRETGIERGQVTKYYFFDTESALPRLGMVVRGTHLLGQETYNLQNARLGKVDNLVLDVPAGRVVEVILASGGFWGIKGELTAVPPQSFILNAGAKELRLDTSLEAFNAAPHFTPGEWGYADQPASIAEVYSLYRVQPFFVTAEPDSTIQNVREPAATYGKSDPETTAQIQKAVMNINDLSTEARNVKITTFEGTVSLTGVVDTADEKRLIGDAAARIAPSDEIDNQLEIRTTPVAVDSGK